MTKTYRLMGKGVGFLFQQGQGQLGGNGRLKIYGRLDCPSALRAIRTNVSETPGIFADEATVIAAGFRACGI
jgi:hypothetical protein